KSYSKENKSELVNEKKVETLSNPIVSNPIEAVEVKQEQKADPQKPVEKKVEEKTKLFIPRLKDVSISSSLPSLNSIFDEKESAENNEPTYIKGTEKNTFTEI